MNHILVPDSVGFLMSVQHRRVERGSLGNRKLPSIACLAQPFPIPRRRFLKSDWICSTSIPKSGKS